MPFLSVVAPFLNEETSVPDFSCFVEKLTKHVADQYGMDVEFVLVDDGSTDQSLPRYLDKLTGNWKIIELSRNFGKEIALFAGLEHSDGEYVMIIDADLQHPYDVCVDMIGKITADPDLDVVYAVRKDRQRDSWRRALGSRFFYWFINYRQRFQMPENGGDFRIMRHNVVEAFLKARDRRRFNKGLYAWTGFRQEAVPYTPDERAGGETKWSRMSLFNLSLEGVTSFSALPLRAFTALGAVTGLLGILYGFHIILDVLINGTDVPGYPSLMVAISVFGGFNLALIGLLGEYLWVAIGEAKDRPLYLVRRIHSSQLVERKKPATRQKAGEPSHARG